MDGLIWILHTPVVRGGASGLLAAAAVDLHAFLSWRDYHQLAEYDWGTAVLRWAQGFVAGAVTALGYQALLTI